MDRSLHFEITSVPQANLRNRTTTVQVGKVVGGSSAINAMMTIRGTRARTTIGGASCSRRPPGWSWEGLLPYFKKAMTFVPPGDEVAKTSGIKFDQKFWGDKERWWWAGRYRFPRWGR